MSELKVYHCNEWHNEYTEFYMKSEADAMIAELKGQVNGFKNRSNLWYYNAVEEHKKFVQVDQQITELKAQKAQVEDDCAYWKTMARSNAADNAVMAKQRAEAIKRESRQKYKRCLAMEKWCHAEHDIYSLMLRTEKWNFIGAGASVGWNLPRNSRRRRDVLVLRARKV